MAKVANKVTTIHSMTHGECPTRNEEHIICSQDTNLVLRYHIQVSEQLYLTNLEIVIIFTAYVTIPQQPNEYAGTGYLSTKYNSFGLK